MKKIKLKYEQLEKAFHALKKMVDRYKNVEMADDPLEYEAYRESIIQRFEYSYDLLWEYLKQFLLAYHDIKLNSPKKVFQECLKQKIISPDETILLEKIVADRNNTTHKYDEEAAEQISKSIIEYEKFLQSLLPRIKAQ